VYDLANAVHVYGFEQMGDLRNIAPVELNEVRVGLEIGTRGRKVEAHDFFTFFEQLANDSRAYESGSACDHDGHGDFSLRASIYIVFRVGDPRM
jgi:hypothetical protein